jgi:Leucine-rich repeat (LRR) protein
MVRWHRFLAEFRVIDDPYKLENIMYIVCRSLGVFVILILALGCTDSTPLDEAIGLDGKALNDLGTDESLIRPNRQAFIHACETREELAPDVQLTIESLLDIAGKLSCAEAYDYLYEKEKIYAGTTWSRKLRRFVGFDITNLSPLAWFADSPHIYGLVVSSYAKLDMATLLPMPNIREILVDATSFEIDKINQEMFPNLDSATFTIPPTAAYAHICNHKSITSLSLQNSELKSENLGFLADSTTCGDFREKLTTLNVNYSNIHDVSFASHLTSLTTLNLAGNQIEDISPLTKLYALKRLVLDLNEIQTLPSMVGLKSLQQLHLSNNPITPTETNIQALQQLQEMDLTYLSIDDAEAGFCSQLSLETCF